MEELLAGAATLLDLLLSVGCAGFSTLLRYSNDTFLFKTENSIPSSRLLSRSHLRLSIFYTKLPRCFRVLLSSLSLRIFHLLMTPLHRSLLKTVLWWLLRSSWLVFRVPVLSISSLNLAYSQPDSQGSHEFYLHTHLPHSLTVRHIRDLSTWMSCQIPVRHTTLHYGATQSDQSRSFTPFIQHSRLPCLILTRREYV
jgi:hypothetical protein